MQTSLLSIKHLVGEAQCCETIRRGFDGPDRWLRRYECKPCGRRKAVSAGLFYSRGLASDGTLTCWGRAQAGQP